MLLSEMISEVCKAYRQVWSEGITTQIGAFAQARSTSMVSANIVPGNSIFINSSSHTITEFDPSTGTVTFTPPEPNPIGIGISYLVTPRPLDDIVSAIRLSMYSMADSWKTAKISESETAISSNIGGTYDLPDDCSSVSLVQRLPNGDVPGSDWIDYPFWEVVTNLGERKLLLKSTFAGKIRVQYYSSPTIPSLLTDPVYFGGGNDRDTIGFILNRTLYELYRMDFSNNPTAEAAKHYLKLSDLHRTEAERIRGNERMSPIATRSRRATRPRMRI